MTVTTAQRLPATPRRLPLRAGALGLIVGLVSAFSGVHAGSPQAAGRALLPMAQTSSAAVLDPAKRAPASVSVSSIDFNRGEGGAGKLILRFSGEGAVPDLQTQGSNVVIDVGNASLPASLQRPINVTDFATPVQRIDANQGASGARIVLSTNGAFESLAYQTGRDYIVEIVPRAAASSRAVGASSAVVTTAQTSAADTRAYRGRPVTFNFQDVPVRTVLQLIAELSNLNIVASDSVQGNVTLRLINVPWDQALDIVLQAKGLDKRSSGNVVWVAPQAEIAKFEQDREDARLALEERAEMVTEYIPISYGNAEDIAKLLTDESKGGQGGAGAAGGAGQARGFLSSRGSISFDRRTNTLLIIDIPQRVAAIRRLVDLLDKPVDQVVIEARIVIANESFARELGARFGISGAVGKAGDRSSLGFGSNTATSSQNALNRSNAQLRGENIFDINRGLNIDLPTSFPNAGSLALSILNAGYLLDVEISALQEEGRGEVISNPRIVTSNQKEAIIRQGQEVGYLTVTGGQSNNVPTVQFKDVLLELKVTPTITADGRVFLNIAVKKDEILDFVSVGAFGDVPQLSKREVTTAVLVDDGHTVVIGGVYEFSNRSAMTKVPFLGDLPVLGNLFKTRGRSKSKAELLIFVTPKVLRVAQRL